MPAVARELSIEYGTVTVGGSTDRILDSSLTPISIDVGYETATVSFEFVTSASSESLFGTEVATLEAGFSTPRQRLRILAGATTLHDFNPADNSGFNADATITKVGDEVDTVRTRRYSVEITIDLPADLAGQDGRQDSSVQLSYSSSRKRTLTVTGSYTALNANDSKTQYEAAIDAYITSLTTPLGGTWELVSEDVTHNDTNTLTDFTRVLKEVVKNQATATLDHDGIIDPDFTITIRTEEPGDSIVGSVTTEKPKTFDVSYSASIDTSNIGGQTIYDFWVSTIRPFVIEEMLAITGASLFAVITDAPVVDEINCTINASITALVYDGNGLLAASVTFSEEDSRGIQLTPAWAGDRLAKYAFRGPGSLSRTLNHTATVLRNGGSRTLVISAAKADVKRLENAGWLVLSTSKTKNSSRVGIGDETVDTLDISISHTLEFVKDPKVVTRDQRDIRTVTAEEEEAKNPKGLLEEEEAGSTNAPSTANQGGG